MEWNMEMHEDESYMVHATPYTHSVDVPGWADIDEGYKPVSANREGTRGSSFAMIVTYAPLRTLGGIGYSRVFIVDSSSNTPFPRMKEMWKELHKRWKEKNEEQENVPKGAVFSQPPYINGFFQSARGFYIPDGITISETGKIRGAFGIPSVEDVHLLVVETNFLYSEWRQFPNETDYAMVKRLLDAAAHIESMQATVSQIEESISESRNIIKEHQDRISTLEKNMNEIYEKGASDMDFLEEHGIEPDIEGIKKMFNGMGSPAVDNDIGFSPWYVDLPIQNQYVGIDLDSSSSSVPYTTSAYNCDCTDYNN